MKTSKYLIFFLSIISFGIEAQNWELVWQDEFTGSSLNEQKWVHEIGTGSQNGLWGWGNGELRYYTSENTTVSNGTLKITAQEESNGIVDPFQTWNTLNYSSSRIKTDGLFSFKYGKVQARIKKGYLLNCKYPILVEMQGIEPWSKQGVGKFSTCLVSN